MAFIYTHEIASSLDVSVFSYPGSNGGYKVEMVVVDVSPRDVQRAVRVIELIKATTLQIAIFASGEMTQPARIVGRTGRSRCHPKVA